MQVVFSTVNSLIYADTTESAQPLGLPCQGRNRSSILLGTAIISLFLLVPLSAQSPSGADNLRRTPDYFHLQRLRELEEEFETLLEDGKKQMGRISEITRDYPNAKDPEALAGERQNLQESLIQLLKELNDLRSAHRNVRNGLRLTMVTRGLKERRGGVRGPTGGSAGIMTRLAPHEITSDIMKRRQNRLGQELSDEATAFESAASVLRSKRMTRKKLFFIFITTGLFAGLAILWGIRRRRVESAQRPALPEGGTPEALPDNLTESYRIERIIGRGGMGVVYETTDITLNRKVAIKRMRKELLAQSKDMEQFLSEARMVASLKHPNLVAIYAIVKGGGHIFLVFEYVAGRTLHSILDKADRLPLRQAMRIVQSIAGALDYAHSERVVHRDLKPANIMLTEKGEVKIMDFGIAYQANKTLARLTRAEAWGTPPYMAPEQEMGGVSNSVDLYALAVVFYEMVTGSLPFSGPNFLAQKREELFRPPREIVPNLPEGIDGVLRKALAARAESRYASGAEFAAAVARLLPTEEQPRSSS